MYNLNLMEVIQILARNNNVKAVKENGCQIVWKNFKKDMSQFHAPDHKYSQMVFINLNGDERTDILTDIMIEQQNYDCWRIESI